MRYINDELKELVLYGDTDSIYCILDRGMYPNLISVTFKNTYSCQYEQKLDPELWVCLGEQVYAYTDGIKYAHTSKGITVDKQGIMTLEDQSQKHLFEVYMHVLFDKINIDKNSNPQYPTIRRYKQKQKQEINFIRDQKDCSIYTNTTYKSIKMDSQKRCIDFNSTLNEIATLSFGYVKE
uniref:DNA-directed DNA polymerase n=1 Tax=Spironucleus salmonicida TaxID=348837 RepID=V6LFW2_9EUKA|eukprot:EST43397.1 Hypothetical protein SS50377_16891 [Spironucleus salmonicida]